MDGADRLSGEACMCIIGQIVDGCQAMPGFIDHDFLKGEAEAEDFFGQEDQMVRVSPDKGIIKIDNLSDSSQIF